MYLGFRQELSVDLYSEDLKKIEEIRKLCGVDDINIYMQFHLKVEGTEDDHPVVEKSVTVYGSGNRDTDFNL